MVNNENGPQQSESVSQWQILWIKAVAFAWKDASFKDALIANPRSALEKTFGYTVPAGVTLKVEQLGKPLQSPGGLVQEDGTVTLPLPAPPDDSADQALALASLMEWYQHDGCCGNPCCS